MLREESLMSIRLRKMSFYAYHGCLEEEKRIGQRFYVDCIVQFHGEKAGQSDALKDTVNYVQVYEIIHSIMEGSSCNLLEHLLYKMGHSILKSSNLIESVTLTIHKTSAPIPGTLEDVEMEQTFTKDNLQERCE